MFSEQGKHINPAENRKTEFGKLYLFSFVAGENTVSPSCLTRSSETDDF